MNKSLIRLASVIMALCLIFANLTPAAAATADKTVPAVTDVAKQAQATASYVLSETNFADIADTSKFYQASRDLLLSIRSGLDCTSYIEAYTASVNKMLNSDGTLAVTLADYGYPNDITACQAYLITTLTVAGFDVENYNGMNLINAFSNLLKDKTTNDFSFATDPDTYENIGMNPYHLGTIYSAVYAYSEKIANSSEIITKIKQALINICDDNGVNYYGYSADNNGIILSPFSNSYSTDAALRELADKTVAYTESEFFDSVDGTTHSKYYDYDSNQLIEMISTDSTACALALYSAYGKNELAAMSYNALLTMASTKTPGAYTYAGFDSLYSSQSALLGLVSYKQALANGVNPYNVSDILNAQKEEETIPDITETESSSENEASPETNDNVNVYFYILALLISISVAGIANIKYKSNF